MLQIELLKKNLTRTHIRAINKKYLASENQKYTNIIITKRVSLNCYWGFDFHEFEIVFLRYSIAHNKDNKQKTNLRTRKIIISLLLFIRISSL